MTAAPRPSRNRCRPLPEALESRAMLSLTAGGAYSGPTYHAIDYGPSWPHWTFVPESQTGDSDFANNAFRGLWGKNEKGVGRNDLGTFQASGFNLVRLYNWGPTRGWDGTKGTGHLNFLDQAQADGLKVMVPVSNFFLGNKYAWDGKNPDANYSFNSAPEAVRFALKNFISSITKNGRIEPAVQSISVGNEWDLNIDSDPGRTAKLQRVNWWLVNLHDQLVKEFGDSASHILLTAPISNADQGHQPSTPTQGAAWFTYLIQGAHKGDPMPNGPGAEQTFTRDVRGLDTFSWYKDWYFNSLNLFQKGTQLANTLQQYDTGGNPNGPVWDDRWPGVKYDVPLMITEIGTYRYSTPTDPRGEAYQFHAVTQDQAKVVEDYIRSSGPHNIMGYTIFEYNDEPNKNNYMGPLPDSETSFGITKYYNTFNQNDFRNGTVLDRLMTGPTRVSYKTFPSIEYPIYQLYPVPNGPGGQSILDRLKSIFISG